MLTRLAPRAAWRAAAVLSLLFLSAAIGVAVGVAPPASFSSPRSTPPPLDSPSDTVLSGRREGQGARSGAAPLFGPEISERVRVRLPDVYRCACDEPAPADPLIFDCSALVTTTHWLTRTFGAVTWSPPAADGLRSTLSSLHACCTGCPAVLVAHVEDELGHPAAGVTVVMHWPDAPLLPAELAGCDPAERRGVYGPTNDRGDVGFGLGGGAYYAPPGGGPHAIWIPGGSCLRGLGMLAGTNHAHLDSGWTLRVPAYADSVALRDWGYTPGSLVYREVVGGREMEVIEWPH